VAVVCALCVLVVCAVAEQTTTFLSLGDWGNPSDGHVVQNAVASKLGPAATKYNATFLLALGDNFYEDGVVNDTDPQWQTTYRQIYTAKSLDIPWYAILGNHDEHLGRGQGQIDYFLNKRDNRWNMPARWYTKTFQGDGFTVEIVFIDTVILALETSTQLIAEKVVLGEAKQTLLADWHTRTESLSSLADDQWAWIQQTLAASKADWLLVAGHYPVFSGGEHGNTPELNAKLLPMLQSSRANVFFCGHDHTLQHLRSNGVDYFVSGNGGKIGTYSPIPQSMYGVVDPGFMVHHVNKTHFVTRMIDMNDKEIYAVTIANKRK